MKKYIVGLFLLFFCANTFAQLNAEQKIIKKTFFDFLHFYQKNEKKFSAFNLYKGKGKENTPPYFIQWKEVNKYFTFLRTQVPYVGEVYIKNELKDFLYYDSVYKAEPTAEIPEGFDYDRWAGGQESTKYSVDWLTNPKNKIEININGSKAVLRIGSNIGKEINWDKIEFVKEKGKWLMAENIHPTD